MTPSGATLGPHALDEHQQAHFGTFGYVRLPGLFAREIEELTDAFEHAFAAAAAQDPPEVLEFEGDLHLNQTRRILMSIADRHPTIGAVRDDPRLQEIALQLLGPGFEAAGSDGSIFSCESSWHADTFHAPLRQHHIKFSFYLDQLAGETGAIRMIPGSNHHQTRFARTLRRALRDPADIPTMFGVQPGHVPSVVVPSEPGDVILWDYRTIHGSFEGGDRRRLFSVSFRESMPPDDQASGADPDQAVSHRSPGNGKPGAGWLGGHSDLPDGGLPTSITHGSSTNQLSKDQLSKD